MECNTLISRLTLFFNIVREYHILATNFSIDDYNLCNGMDIETSGTSVISVIMLPFISYCNNLYNIDMATPPTSDAPADYQFHYLYIIYNLIKSLTLKLVTKMLLPNLFHLVT